MRFPNLHALSELPYFCSNAQGQLRLAEPVGPIFDAHTHLALTFGRTVSSVDLLREHPQTEHYLPPERPLDFEIYLNKNFSAADLKALRRDLSTGSLLSSGMRRTHTLPNLLREMAALGIEMSALLPVELPLLSRNAEHYLQVAAQCDKVISFGSVHPISRNVGDRLAQQKAAGARGVKLHPAAQLMPADHPRAMTLYRVCAELKLPVLWHCGPVGIEPRLGRWCSQLKHYWRAVRDNPDVSFILGHAGALQMSMALDLAKSYDNVYLELSSQSRGNIATIIEQAPTDRLLFGTDWPFYHQAIQLAKVLLVTEGKPALRRRVLWDNAAVLLDLSATDASR